MPDLAQGQSMSKTAPDKTAVGAPGPGRPAAARPRRGKFVVYGEEMIEKRVKLSSNAGRVYLPSEWVGKRVRIILVG